MTRHSNTTIAREKLLFGRLGSISGSVRFILFPILIDAFSFTAMGKPQFTQPFATLYNLVSIHAGWGAAGNIFRLETAALVAGLPLKRRPYYPPLTLTSRDVRN